MLESVIEIEADLNGQDADERIMEQCAVVIEKAKGLLFSLVGEGMHVYVCVCMYSLCVCCGD